MSLLVRNSRIAFKNFENIWISGPTVVFRDD